MVEMKFLDENTGELKPAVFCFTGKSPRPRSQMEAIALKTGALVTKSVTNKTTILVIADANSTSIKAQKSRASGINLISPSQFFIMIRHAFDNSITVSHSNDQIEIQKPTEKRQHSSVRRIEL